MALNSTDDAAFDGWVAWVFDHPVTEPEWYQGENVERWTSSSVITIDYITRLFEAAPTYLCVFSDA